MHLKPVKTVDSIVFIPQRFLYEAHREAEEPKGTQASCVEARCKQKRLMNDVQVRFAGHAHLWTPGSQAGRRPRCLTPAGNRAPELREERAEAAALWTRQVQRLHLQVERGVPSWLCPRARHTGGIAELPRVA